MNKFKEILKQSDEQRKTVAQNYQAHKEKRHQETLDIVAEFAGKTRKRKSNYFERIKKMQEEKQGTKKEGFARNMVDDSIDVHKAVKAVEKLCKTHSMTIIAEVLGVSKASYIKNRLNNKLVNANFGASLKRVFGDDILRDDYDPKKHGVKHRAYVDFSKYSNPKEAKIIKELDIDPNTDHEAITRQIKESLKTTSLTKLAEKIGMSRSVISTSMKKGKYTKTTAKIIQFYYDNAEGKK